MTSTLSKRPIISVAPKIPFEERLKQILDESNDCSIRSIDGKTWYYCMYDETITSPVHYGTCAITDITYDITVNRNIYTIVDINSKEEYTVDEFYLRLWDNE